MTAERWRRASIPGIMATALAAGAGGLDGQPACTPGNGGIVLPQGFCAVVVHEGVGPARHLTVAPNGDVFVAVSNSRSGPGSVVGLRDTDGDGRADRVERFGPEGGNGILLHGGYLYFAPNDRVLRWRYGEGALVPAGEPETVVSGLPDDRSHRAKSLVIRGEDLYVNHGSPSNSCQQDDRARGSPGQDPCAQLETRAGIWRYDAGRTGQTLADGTRFATGMRNTVALALNPADGELYGAIHGRDQLHDLYPDLYTEEQSAELPAEELVHIRRGDDFGWPYCYYDQRAGRKVLAPEYGGDGRRVGRCADKRGPLVGFPGHWAPDDLVFYTGEGFPTRYRGGAFIAFHGSWNRAPLPQGGYKVVFVPMADGRVTGDWEVFADGFAGDDVSPGGARFRPVGLAQGPDGSLYVSESQEGRVWKVVYRGAM